MSVDTTQDMLDLYDGDGRSNCPRCGEPLTADEDGDGVMTMSYYFCEHCGGEDDGEGKTEAEGDAEG